MKYLVIILIVFSFSEVSFGLDLRSGARELPLNDAQQRIYAGIFAKQGIKCRLPVRRFMEGNYGDAVRIETIACAGGNKQETHYYREEPALTCYIDKNGFEGCDTLDSKPAERHRPFICNTWIDLNPTDPAKRPKIGWNERQKIRRDNKPCEDYALKVGKHPRELKKRD